MTRGPAADGGSGPRRRRLLAAFLTAGAVVLADQVTKSLAVADLTSGPVHLLGPLSLQLAYNDGVAFSLGAGLTLPIVLVGVGLVVLLVWALRGAPSLPVAVGLGLVIGGACSNLGDRLFRGRGGAVVDFVHLGVWPTFNLADSAIVCGCLLLALVLAHPQAHPQAHPVRPGEQEQGNGGEGGGLVRSALTVPTSLEGERLDRVVAFLSGRSRAIAAELVGSGAVRLGGRQVPGSRRVHAGEVLELDLPPVPAGPAAPGPSGEVVFEVVHEEPSFAVVDKPAGLVVHPGAGHREGTLVSGLLARYPELGAGTAEGAWPAERPGIVHRLDKETSGLLVVARLPEAYRALAAQLAARTMGRTYRTVALGTIRAEEGTIDAPLGRSTREPTKVAVRADGRPARTRYRVLRRFAGPPACTLAEVTLETGRTHQIRVHLAAIGHPVLGDLRYGGGGRRGAGLTRPFLHAERLRLAHPLTGEELTFESPLPGELAGALEALSSRGDGPA